MESAEIIPSLVERSKRLRSRVTNGKSPFIGADGRSAWVRLWKDLLGAHASDLGGDLSEAQRASCEVVATLRTELKLIEAKMSNGEASPEDIDLYNRLSGNLRRYLEMLGLERRARPSNDGTEILLKAHGLGARR